MHRNALAFTARWKALARAHRWQRRLDSGGFSSIEELAKAERINPSYLARVLRLTLLAPDIVECILDGRHEPEQVSLDRLMKPFPGSWEQQLSVPSKIGCGRRVICRGQLTFGQARRKPPAANTVLQSRLDPSKNLAA